jgi:hypothetical protein
MQTQQISRPPNHETPLLPNPGWWAALSRRSKLLGLIALLTRVVSVIASLADRDARRGPFLAFVAVSAAAGIAALVSMAADLAAARREGNALYWRGLADGIEIMHPELKDDTGTGNVVELSTRRRGGRRSPAQRIPGAARPAGDGRRQVAAFAAVALLVGTVTASAMWDLANHGAGGPSVGTPAIAQPSTSTQPTSAQPSSAPATGASAQPSSSHPAAGPGAGLGSTVITSPTAAGTTHTPSTDPIGDGTYRVGVDIAAGTWKAGKVVTAPIGSCAYSINSGPTQKPLVSAGAITVTLAAGDRFTTTGCPPWRRA